MNLRQMKTEEIALLLHGLRAIWVEDQAATHEKLTIQLETELSARGYRLNDENNPKPQINEQTPAYYGH